jgi:hypothetical protein
LKPPQQKIACQRLQNILKMEKGTDLFNSSPSRKVVGKNRRTHIKGPKSRRRAACPPTGGDLRQAQKVLLFGYLL